MFEWNEPGGGKIETLHKEDLILKNKLVYFIL